LKENNIYTKVITGFFFSILIFSGCNKNPIESNFDHYNWGVVLPEQQNMSSQILDSAFIKAKNTGFIDGLLVIRNGNIVHKCEICSV